MTLQRLTIPRPATRRKWTAKQVVSAFLWGMPIVNITRAAYSVPWSKGRMDEWRTLAWCASEDGQRALQATETTLRRALWKHAKAHYMRGHRKRKGIRG